MNRRGMSILAIVLLLGVIASILVFAYHSMWRGSSRTLFSVQEQRELVNLGRSALSEAYYEVQHSMDEGTAEWVDWCIALAVDEPRPFVPQMTLENAGLMAPDPRFLRYEASDIAIHRVRGLTLEEANNGQMGLLDLHVTVSVRRESPRHEAKLSMLARHTFRFAMSHGPYGAGGRHIQVSQTPVATWIEAE